MLACPGCGGQAVVRMRIAAQPVVLNYRLATPAEAEAVPRGDIALAQCGRCGLAFNGAFDETLLPYDDRYENAQSHSPTFLRYLEVLARDLIDGYGVHGKRVLEVGCGKGAFLMMLVALGDNTGHGYDTTWEDDNSSRDPRLTFVARRLTPCDITTPYDAIVCRHVIEHVADVRRFLTDLCAITEAAGDPIVLLETPAFEWICENACFWDVFYEHCNYFSMSTLAWLCEDAGFRVISHERRFEDQYQTLWLRRSPRARSSASPGVNGADLAIAAAAMENRRRQLDSELEAAGAARGWAIWGAGAKGVTLAHRLAVRPSCLVDMNPAKQGGYIPGLAIPIVSPDDARVGGLNAILVANPIYAAEIRSDLQNRGFSPRVLTA